MSLEITERAAEKVRQALHKRNGGHGIRVGVRTTGCSGLAYSLEFVDAAHTGDLVFESQLIKIFVDPKSYSYLRGISMDYATEEFNEGFVFINPNEKARCGCGESFTV